MSNSSDAQINRAAPDEEDDGTETALVVPNFPSSCPHPKAFTFFTERYFSQYIIRDCKGIKGNHVRLLLHSNGLCVVCIDPSNVLCQKSAKIKQLSHSTKKDRAGPIKVQGKRKKNALLCQRDMVVCFVDLDAVDSENSNDEANAGPVTATRQIRVPACVDGLILEINPYLVKRPQLLQEAPLTEGFIAIVNPHAKMNFDEYEKLSSATSGEMSAGVDVE